MIERRPSPSTPPEAVVQAIPLQVDRGELVFDPLDFQDTNGVSLEEAHEQAKQARAAIQAAIRKTRPDLKTRAARLTGQLRPYRSFGVPDGRFRTVFYLRIDSTI